MKMSDEKTIEEKKIIKNFKDKPKKFFKSIYKIFLFFSYTH